MEIHVRKKQLKVSLEKLRILHLYLSLIIKLYCNLKNKKIKNAIFNINVLNKIFFM